MFANDTTFRQPIVRRRTTYLVVAASVCLALLAALTPAEARSSSAPAFPYLHLPTPHHPFRHLGPSRVDQERTARYLRAATHAHRMADVTAASSLIWLQARQQELESLSSAVAQEEAKANRVRQDLARPPPPPLSPTDFGDLSSVVQCIKDHESGNYAESSHPGSGSGAYQFIPGTWQHWSMAAGYSTTVVVNGQSVTNPTYQYAYQAPPAVQDAVLMYTLTHGGAHNWDSAFGNDPCTEHLP